MNVKRKLAIAAVAGVGMYYLQVYAFYEELSPEEAGPMLREHVVPFLRDTLHLGSTPLFSGPAYGPSMLAAGVILAIMALPYISAVTREVLLAAADQGYADPRRLHRPARNAGLLLSISIVGANFVESPAAVIAFLGIIVAKVLIFASVLLERIRQEREAQKQPAAGKKRAPKSWPLAALSHSARPRPPRRSASLSRTFRRCRRPSSA